MISVKHLIEDKRLRKRLFPGIRNKRLLELSALHFAFFYDEKSEPAKTIIKRVREKGHYPSNIGIVYGLEPADVTAVLGCSERKAKEYIKVLQILMR